MAPLQGVSGGRQQSRLFADGVRVCASESGACLCRTADRRAKLVRPKEPLRSYRWSSYPAYLERPGRRPAWLRVERVLGEMGIAQDSAAGRREFERLMEERRAQDDPEEYGRIRRGWCWGEEAFRKELLAQVEEKRGASHCGGELQESATEKAERLVREGLAKLGWREAALAARKNGDKSKLKLAVKLRAETTTCLPAGR